MICGGGRYTGYLEPLYGELAMNEEESYDFAPVTDLVNSWCREQGLPEAEHNGLAVRDAVKRLWEKTSGTIEGLRRRRG